MIHKLNSTVDKRFAELNGSLSSLKSAFSEISEQVSLAEAATESDETQTEELEKRCDSLASQLTQHQVKVDDLEARSRRQNIRIIGIKEKAEEGRLTEFVTKLLLKLLGEKHFDRPVEVDRAHRSLAPAKDGKPRAIIARLHHAWVKELVLKLSRENSPLQ